MVVERGGLWVVDLSGCHSGNDGAGGDHTILVAVVMALVVVPLVAMGHDHLHQQCQHHYLA